MKARGILEPYYVTPLHLLQKKSNSIVVCHMVTNQKSTPHGSLSRQNGRIVYVSSAQQHRCLRVYVAGNSIIMRIGQTGQKRCRGNLACTVDTAVLHTLGCNRAPNQLGWEGPTKGKKRGIRFSHYCSPVYLGFISMQWCPSVSDLDAIQSLKH